MDPPSPPEYDGTFSEGESSADEQAVKTESAQCSPSDPAHAHDNKSSATNVKPLGHLQKRRRVTRACDECRRKKIKCDGKQPCTHCTVYSYECTYDQPSNRRRNPAPQYVENLEHRVHRAESLLHILFPNLDLNDPGIDAAVAQGWIPGAPGKGNPSTGHPDTSAAAVAAAAVSTASQYTPPTARPAEDRDSAEKDMKLESMIRAVAQLEIDEWGHWDYHGHSSGLSFVRRIREQLGDLMGPDTIATPFVKSRAATTVIDSPKSNTANSPMDDISSQGIPDLPNRQLATQLCSNALQDAAALLRVVHHPTFWASFDRLYRIPPEQYRDADHKFLPQYYSAMALGSVFGKHDSPNFDGYENAIQQGSSYFKIARQMMDIADCRDLSAIQAIIFMIMFLQSSAKLSQCYTYVGVALRASLRMGLHRAAPGRFNAVEAETRKRVFWIVRKMDIYVGALLGLPQTLSDDDIDQEFPIEIDDEYITADGILPMPEGVVSIMAAFNAHTRLVQLLSKIVRNVYPIKVNESAGRADKSYSVRFSVIRDIESDLEKWKTDLPQILNPCGIPSRYAVVRQLLRLSYAHCQIMLYRPFLHYTAMEKRSQAIDQRAYACAASFVNVSRNIIHVTTQMKQNGFLNGSFWFIMYTTFFSVLALVYFAVENPDNPTTEAVIKDAFEGKEVLASLASRSMAADRATATLDTIFRNLPTWLQKGQMPSKVATKKRTFESFSVAPAQQSRLSGHQTSSAVQDMPNTNLDVHGVNGHPAHPFSDLAQTGSSNMPSSSFGSPWSQSTSSYAPMTPGSGVPHPFDATSFPSSMPTPGVPQLNYPPNFANPALTDLSSMMFPTADEPFVYPNQPLTTFENHQQFVKGPTYLNDPHLVASAAAPNSTPSSAQDEHIEAQFFALPPFMEQQRPDHPQQPSGGPRAMSAEQHGVTYPTNGNTTAIPTNPLDASTWLSQQQRGGDLQPHQQNINIQDLFGGTEWNPTMMPVYQQ